MRQIYHAKLIKFLKEAQPYQAQTTPEHLAKLIAAGMIEKKNLEPGKYYYGTCRNASVSKWNGIVFTYIRHKFGSSFPEDINHPEDDNGYDLFYPVSECEPEEGEKIK